VMKFAQRIFFSNTAKTRNSPVNRASQMKIDTPRMLYLTMELIELKNEFRRVYRSIFVSSSSLEECL